MFYLYILCIIVLYLYTDVYSHILKFYLYVKGLYIYMLKFYLHVDGVIYPYLFFFYLYKEDICLYINVLSLYNKVL